MIDEGCIHSADDIGFPCDSVYRCDTIGDTLLKRTGLNHGILPISEINAQWCIGSRISTSVEIYLREASMQWFIPRETINCMVYIYIYIYIYWIFYRVYAYMGRCGNTSWHPHLIVVAYMDLCFKYRFRLFITELWYILFRKSKK